MKSSPGLYVVPLVLLGDAYAVVALDSAAWRTGGQPERYSALNVLVPAPGLRPVIGSVT
eukprot:COSAG02_NODE_43759_length_372_cov_0.560440_1_plen_58_part_10